MGIEIEKEFLELLKTDRSPRRIHTFLISKNLTQRETGICFQHLTSKEIMEVCDIALSRISYKSSEIGKKEDEEIVKSFVARFKESVVNGTYEEFLNSVSLEVKKRLILELNLFGKGEDFSPEEQVYSEVLNESIARDLDTLAQEKGYRSYDEMWKALMNPSNPFAPQL